MYSLHKFDKLVVEVEIAVFFKHQLYTIFVSLYSKILVEVYELVLILSTFEGGERIFRVEMIKKPRNTNSKSNII